MPTTATNYGTAQNKAAATTVTVTTTALIPVNTLLVLAVCADNVAAATPVISSITAVGGGTWVNQAGAVSQSGASTTAGSGVFVYCQTLLTTNSVSSGTVITITFNASPIAKSVVLDGLTETTNTLRNTVVAAASTAGTPSAITAGTALVAGDIVIGVIGGENSAVPTGDTDTLNGSWSAIDGIATTGSSAATNTAVGMQFKVVTATGAQTYNPVSANDAVAIVFALQPLRVAPVARSMNGGAASSTSVALAWPTDSAAVPTPTYLIETSPDGTTGWTTVASGQVNQTGYTATGLTTGTAYYFRVTGSNVVGSATSNVVGPLTPTVLAYANSFEGGTDETTISAANSGGASGDAFKNIFGAPVYDTARAYSGTVSMRAQTTTSAQSSVNWNFSPDLRSSLWSRCYLYVPSGTLPTSDRRILGSNGYAFLTTTGKIKVGSSVFVTSTNTIAFDQWIRLETGLAGGTLRVRLYNNPESTTPTEEVVGSEALSGTASATNFGAIDTQANLGPWWFDDLAMSDVDWIGPLPPPPRNIHLSNAALQPSFNR